MGDVNPVDFGKLIGSVESLIKEVSELTKKVDELETRMNTGKGLLAGLLIVAGGAGASMQELIGRLLK